MFFLDRHEPSLGPKGFIWVCMTMAMVMAGWMMFASPESEPIRFRRFLLDGDPLRQKLVFACLFVYWTRLTVTILVFFKRKLLWAETIIISLSMSLVLLVFARTGGSNPAPVGLVEIMGIVLYLLGSYLNTCSEYQRQRFKSDSSNRGRLFTSALFRLARHINYFGDVLLFSGLALVTGRPGTLVIPLVMTLNFGLILIPRKEAYLSRKYGRQFTDYSSRTKRFIPFVY